MSIPLPSSTAPAPNRDGSPLLSVQEEAHAFWQLRWRMVRTYTRQMLAHSRFRLTLIGVLSALLWAGMFWLFADGFRFLETAVPHAATYDRTVRAVFSTFFAALLLMLIFSSSILLYSSLFRAADLEMLLTLPARVERVFLHKFQEAILFSSWAFILMGSPMLLAYGIVQQAPWYYFVMLVPFLVAFIYIPAGVGAVLCIAIVHRAPRGRTYILAAAGAAALCAAVWIAWSLLTGPEGDMLSADWFRQVSARIKFSDQQLLPSWWLSSGLLEAARYEWDQGVLFLSLLVANALLFRQLAVWTAGRIYRAAYGKLHGKPVARSRARPAWFDRALVRLVPCSLQMRLLVVKDFRLFRRDPVQWSQFLIFFGLLGVYFLNIRRFNSAEYHVGWVNMVSFLNLSVVGLILSTLTTRFIFPMISLEVRRFWMLGLLPLRRETILWSKFLFAVGGSVVPCSLLILFSDMMLRVSPVVLASHQVTCVLLCVGLSGIAVGLGAKMPSPRETSPSRIAAGFGGTLNLVLSALFILAVVMLTALPCHFYLLSQHTIAASFMADRPNLLWWLHFWLIAGTAGSILLSVLATFLPMWAGFRAFRKMEF